VVEKEEEEEMGEYDDDQIPGEEERDDTDDFVGYLAYLTEKAKVECIVDRPPSNRKAWTRRRR
jgi:hypothetical protein